MVEQAHQSANSTNGLINTRFPLYGYVGIMIIAAAEIFLFSGVRFVQTYFTPIVWSGYILFIDALNYRLHAQSFLRTRPREFALMLLWSVICWLIFEAYNVYLQNWRYVGLPENIVYRWFGYVWAFATIFPAILETAELCRPWFGSVRIRPLVMSNRVLFRILLVGAAFLIIPLILNQHVASHLFAFVWIGFALVLEPINYWLGGRSIIRDLREGRVAMLLGLVTAGLVCGMLWEFWNYWSGAKWVYSVPIGFLGPRIFEMPLLGYLGFPAFAVEVYSFQNFLVTALFRRQFVPIST